MAYETAIIIFISAMAFLFIYLSVNLTKEHKLLAIILLLFVFPLFLLGAGAVNDIVDLGVANVTAFRWSYDEEGNKVHFDGNVMIGGADGYSSDGITLWGTGNNKGSGYFAQDLLVDGEMVLVEGASVNGTEVSFIDAIFDKGNSSNRFRDAYFSGNYYGNGTVQATTFYGSGAGLTELSTDTNATTECGNTQLLRGDGSCVEESGLGGTDLTNVAFINNSNTFTPDQYFSGNVGIGTTSPTSLLYVDGTANITGGSGQSGLVVDSGGRVLIGGIGGSNGDLFVKGSVGFGHTNPADFSADFNRLIVGDGVGNEGMVIWSAATGKSTLAFNDVATISGGIDYDHNTDDFNITALDSIKFETGTNAGDDFIVNTNSLVIEGDNGNVGIGVTDPETTLEVSGGAVLISNNQELQWENSIGDNLRILDLDSSNNLNFARDDSITDLQIFGRTLLYDDAASPSNTIVLNPASNADSYFNTGGNVGIGTSSPTTDLHITGNILLDAGDAQINVDGGAVNALFYSGSSASQIGTTTTHDFRIQSANTNRIVLNTTGGFNLDTSGIPGFSAGCTLKIASNGDIYC